MRAIAAAVLAVCGGAASAAPVTVRGGEHAAFTRVVLDLPVRSPFEIDESGPIKISVSAARDGFDVSEAMRKLNAGRVIGIFEGEDSELLLALGCDCDVDAFFVEDAMLVIDIRGDPSLQNVARKRPVMRRGTEQSPAQEEETETAGEEFSLPVVFSSVAQGNQTPFSEVLPPSEPTMNDAAVERVERQYDARDQMLRQVSRGVSQGLLKPAQSLPVPRLTRQEAEADLPEKQSLPEAVSNDSKLNMRIVTSADRDFVESRNTPLSASLGQSCARDETLFVHGWVGDEEFSERVGRLRSRLYGEFDRADLQTARELVQTYIAYGFGLEALQTLQSTGLEAQDLTAMAHIVEGGAMVVVPPADWQPNCDTAAALWAYLGGVRGSKNAPLNTRAVIAAFGALPIGLKAHLAARLAQRLEDDGFKKMAEQVLRIGQRGAVDIPAGVTLAEASLGETDGEKSEKKLRDVIEANDVESPLALISLIELRTAKDSSVAEADIELVEAYAKEYRGEPIAPKLERALSMALAQRGDFDRSVGVLAGAAPKLERDLLSSATENLVARMVRDAGDIEFLALAFDERVQSFDLSSAGEHSMADRLIDMGFAEQALILLSGPAADAEGRSRKILRAKAALELGRSRQAEAELLGLHGKDVMALRLQARLLRKDHQAARISLETSGNREEAAEQAWLGGEWDALRALESEGWALEASLSELDSGQALGAASLSAGRNLLATSEDLRALVGDVLSRHQITDVAPLD